MNFFTKTGPMLVGLMLIASVCQATRVQRLSLTEIRDHASTIVVALVSYEETRPVLDGKMVWTDYQLSIEEVLRGTLKDTVRVLSFAGGQANGHDVGIAGVPRLESGRRYVLFLLPDGTPWASPTVGSGQGIFEVIPALSSRQPEVLVSYDGEPLEMGLSGLRRGQLVQRSAAWIEAPAHDTLRTPREAEPTVLNTEEKPIEQPARPPEPGPEPLSGRTFASLDQLRSFVIGEIQEDTGESKQ